MGNMTMSLLGRLNLSLSAFKGLSWRAGGAISARAAGVPLSVIKALGRWESSAVLCYLPGSQVDLASAQRRLGRITADSVRTAGTSAFLVGGFDSRGLWRDEDFKDVQ
jgi:hypothetical protein